MSEMNLDWAANTMRGVLLDQKPRLDPAIPSEKNLYDQMTRMFTGLFVSAAPEDYLTLPDENPNLAKYKGKYPDHGIGYAFLKECSLLRTRLNDFDVHNFKILGEDFAFRRKGKRAVDQFNDADLLILGKSDFHGLAQFLELLETKRADQPVMIINYKGFWNPMIEMMGGADALEARGVYVIKKAKEFPVVFNKIGIDPTKLPVPNQRPFTIKPDSLILSNTGTSHKPNEQRESLEFFGARATIVPLGLAIESAESAPEISWSYEGNNHEKHAKAYERMEKLGAEEVAARLALRGIKPEQAYIMSSDSGMGFIDPDMVDSRLFDNARSDLPKLPHQMQPGTELAYLIDRSVDNLMAGFRDAHSRKLETLRQTDPDAQVNLSVRDYSYFTISPLVIPEGESWQDHSVTVFGATNDVLLLKPAVSKYGHIYSEHYTAPAENPKVAKSDIPNFMEGKSSIALGIQSLMELTGLESSAKTALNPTNDFGKVANDNLWRVGTPSTTLYTKSLRHAFERAACEAIPTTCKQVGMREKTPITIDIKTPDGIVSEIAYSRRNRAEEFDASVNAFWFPKIERPSSDLAKIQELKMLSRILVNRQVYAASTLNKAIIIGNPELIRLVDQLHRMKLIGDRPHHLYEKADSHRRAASIVKTMLDRHFVPTDTKLPARQYGGVLDDEGLYRVAVFNSASTKNKDLKDPEKAFGKMLALNGFALVNGGGSQGSMLETQEGYAEGRREVLRMQDERGRIKTSSAAYQSYDTFKIEGLCELPDFCSIEPTRALRIDRLMDVNGIAAGAGGIGTVEEILEEAENILIGGPERPRILVNVPIKTDKGMVKCHDPILEMLPSSIVEKFQQVDRHEEALEILLTDRRKMGMEVQYVQNLRTVPQLPGIALG